MGEGGEGRDMQRVINGKARVTDAQSQAAWHDDDCDGPRPKSVSQASGGAHGEKRARERASQKGSARHAPGSARKDQESARNRRGTRSDNRVGRVGSILATGRTGSMRFRGLLFHN